MNQKQISTAVFYAKKHINNNAVFECAVMLTPIHNLHRVAYNISVEMCGEDATLESFTHVRDEAERIFDKIVCAKIKPRELDTFIRSISE